MLKLETFKQSLIMSVRNIKNNKMRSFLTMLGIIIGVSAVISLITIVSSVTEYMMGEFSNLGADSLTISISGTALKSGLSENDLSEISHLDNVVGISPSVSVITNVVRNGNVNKEVNVSGRNEYYFSRNGSVCTGRPLRPSDMQGNVKVCVIDKVCAESLFLGENPVGQTLMIGGIQYTVVGMRGEDNNLMSQLSSGAGEDGNVYIPYRNALTMNGKNSVSSLEIYVEDTTQTEVLTKQLETLLYNTFNGDEDAYRVINMGSMVDMFNAMTTMMTTLLVGIASIALVVGGIGIMNMMLVNVTERTKEIGLRKALGAEPGVIQLQFLLESVILSVFGGAIGILLGELISYAASPLLGTTFKLNWSAILLGFSFSLIVGIIFGWAPARSASRLNPIEALRSE